MTITPLRLLSADDGGCDGNWIETVFKVAEQEAPEELRLELIEGEIIVSGVPDGHHEHILSRITRQITRHSAEEMDISGHKGVQVPIGGGCPKDHVIPDLTVAPMDADLFRHAEGWMPPGGITLVGEVTSSNGRTDREGERRCYARAAIPLYLLVDRDARHCALFSSPEDGDYTDRHTVVFGKDVALPPPFEFGLSTSDF